MPEGFSESILEELREEFLIQSLNGVLYKKILKGDIPEENHAGKKSGEFLWRATEEIAEKIIVF